MKLAVIAPPQSQGVITTMRLSFHLVLAQYVGDFAYRSFYKAVHRRGDFIMLDNGIGEGVSLSLQDLMLSAGLVEADEITLPDVIGDGDATVAAANAACPLVPKHMRAVCPHGRTWGEWEECARRLVALGVATICIGRYDNLPGGRLPALDIIAKNYWNWTHNIHMFGCAYPPMKSTREELAQGPWIRSMDTGAPIAYAQEKQLIGDLSPHVSLDWHEGTDSRFAERNVDLLLDVCHGG